MIANLLCLYIHAHLHYANIAGANTHKTTEKSPK